MTPRNEILKDVFNVLIDRKFQLRVKNNEVT